MSTFASPETEGNGPLDGVGVIADVVGFIPGLHWVPDILSGVVGAATDVPGITDVKPDRWRAGGVGSNTVDRAMSGVETLGGLAGTAGSIANTVGGAAATGLELTTSLGAIGAGAGSAGAGALAGAAAVGQVAAAGAAGYGYGNVYQRFIERNGLAGQDAAGRNRSLADKTADDGVGVMNAIDGWVGGEGGSFRDQLGDGLGYAGGLATVGAQSVLHTGAAIASLPAVVADAFIPGGLRQGASSMWSWLAD